MTAELKNAFSVLTGEQQVRVLASYAHELTMIAREGYEVGTEHLTNPALVRRINEIQHRVTSAIVSRLANCEKRYPDDVLIEIIASDSEHDGKRFSEAFKRAWRMATGVNGADLPK